MPKITTFVSSTRAAPEWNNNAGRQTLDDSRAPRAEAARNAAGQLVPRPRLERGLVDLTLRPDGFFRDRLPSGNGPRLFARKLGGELFPFRLVSPSPRSVATGVMILDLIPPRNTEGAGGHKVNVNAVGHSPPKDSPLRGRRSRPH